MLALLCNARQICLFPQNVFETRRSAKIASDQGPWIPVAGGNVAKVEVDSTGLQQLRATLEEKLHPVSGPLDSLKI